jgi:hypothetical protein
VVVQRDTVTTDAWRTGRILKITKGCISSIRILAVMKPVAAAVANTHARTHKRVHARTHTKHINKAHKKHTQSTQKKHTKHA